MYQAQDIPMLLSSVPSLVENSDAGAGVGYTGLRIRGSDPTQVNVTINGIPFNDAESQGVFWVNLPDLAASAAEIQVQRGVGTSSNGAGAFGATVNIDLSKVDSGPFRGGHEHTGGLCHPQTLSLPRHRPHRWKSGIFRAYFHDSIGWLHRPGQFRSELLSPHRRLYR